MIETKPTDPSPLGQRLERADGWDKVSGHMDYVADLKLPGMLHAKILRSPHAHARIRSINLEKARALPGVRCVVTADDLLASSDEPPGADLVRRTEERLGRTMRRLAHEGLVGKAGKDGRAVKWALPLS